MGTAVTLHITDAVELTRVWIGSKELAELAGVSNRVARIALKSALEGRPWHGANLEVRESTTSLGGGRGGIAYEVNVSSLPEALQKRWQRTTGAVAAVDTVKRSVQVPARVIQLPTLTNRSASNLPKPNGKQADWKREILEPALKHPSRSEERRLAVKAITSRSYRKPSGKRFSPSSATIYRWLKEYENEGLAALEQARRSDVGQNRVLISQRWDRSCPLPPDKQAAISTELTRYIRSLWASGTPGWRQIQQLGTSRLMELAQGAGWNAPPELLKAICKVPRPRIEQERDYSMIAVKEQDAKRFFDRFTPRVLRTRNALSPMDLVVGDVHPLDVPLRREDGSIVYPRAIAWHDIATNRLYFTLVALRKREGVRRLHVALSFASMARAWGLPARLYLDNGSEYSWDEMINSFNELSHMTKHCRVHLLEDDIEARAQVDEQRSAVIRARPYNAMSKPIEGLFSVMEQGPLAMVPGWVGGNRMRKKTHNVGKEPEPFGGTWEEYQGVIETALRYYHRTPQYGTLKGLSPHGALETAIEKGWGKVAVEEQVIMLAMATREERTVDRGYIEWPGHTYYDDALLPLTGKRVEVRVAEHDPRAAFIFHNDSLVCAAKEAPVFGMLDGKGAHEQSRRTSVLRRVITARKQDCDRLDLVEELERHLSHEAPAPSVPVQATVEITQEMSEMLAALEAAGHQKSLPKRGAPRRLAETSQWLKDENPLLSQFAPEEETEEEINA